MNSILNHWYYLVIALAVGAGIGLSIYKFIKSPTSAQIAAVKEWLKYAVTIAEAELGSGTGQLKLRMVYDMFVSKFTWVSKIISFDKFSTYVDEALEWLDKQLETNTFIATLVTGNNPTVTTQKETIESEE